MNITVFDTSITINGFRLESADVAKFIAALPEEQREHAITQAIEVGVFCLERARIGQDLDFVRREMESLLASVQRALEQMPENTERQISAKIGTGEGQVLAPIQALINEISRAASEKVDGIRTLLQEEVDPRKETSSLGKALRAVRDLLDPMRTDSVQGSLDTAVKHVVAENGPLAKAVHDVVSQALKPLEEKVTDLAKEMRGQEAAAEALEQTTLKGASFEDEVVRRLQAWAQGLGAEVHHMGTDNQPGDVLIVMREFDGRGIALRIVIEAKDQQTPLGRKAISDMLDSAMAKRDAASAIYVSKNRGGLAKEIGEWAESSQWVACTSDHLVTAVRFIIVQQRLQQLRSTAAAVDAQSIEGQIQRMRTSLGKIKNIKTKVTNVLQTAEEIAAEADALRNDANDVLSQIEAALKVRPGVAVAGHVDGRAVA
jgi:hypothetical protein